MKTIARLIVQLHQALQTAEQLADAPELKQPIVYGLKLAIAAAENIQERERKPKSVASKQRENRLKG